MCIHVYVYVYIHVYVYIETYVYSSPDPKELSFQKQEPTVPDNAKAPGMCKSY